MVKVSGCLMSICPSLEHIKLDKRRAEEFPNLLQFLECPSQSCDYMIQIFKEPIIKDCSCNACITRLIKPVRMPREVYERVMDSHMPMPIPKPIGVGDKETDVLYMSFVEAHTLPFTNEHQTSLTATTLRAATRKKKTTIRQQIMLRVASLSTAPSITKLKNKSNFKIGVAAKVRGVVECNNCRKPR